MKQLLQTFIDYLSSEKGLAHNTLESYKRDVSQFIDFQQENNIADIREIEKIHIQKYLLEMKHKGRAASTVSRCIVSIRSYFQYLSQENLLINNPSLQIDAPKLERRFPQVLTVDEATNLLEAADKVTPAGIRDKAMLEMFLAAINK